ncbi:phage antirepressor KilAC domain-containing protein [Xenorhabdus sp. TS4]|uniref:phage antirepressor KilAC domain-containing protein n=1 Tax=Xenorhabdus sp. TS4 TaxID=1873483 RepID=UPI001CA3D3CA|nr:phage antirepressor KilAC domain-containing protein [Xenorhabdus sp. TS4]MBC8949332.1 DNA-binding protein [Xenorhabdus sp. TS4]
MQNLITTELQMTSQEIADLVDSRHDSVKRAIERLAKQGVIQLPPMVISENINGLGLKQKTQSFVFSGEQGKRDSIVVVAQLSPEFTARLVDRWQALENKLSQPQIPQSLPEALRLAADLAEQKAVLEHKVESMENLFKEGMTATQFCKMLNGVNVQKVNHFLHLHNWLYNESKSGKNLRWRATSYARDRYLTEKQNEFNLHGEEAFIKFQPVLLQKGAQKIYQHYLANELPMKKNWDGLHTHDKSVSVAA